MQAQQKAQAVTIINIGQQISSAVVFYVSEWNLVPLLTDLSYYQEYKAASHLTDTQDWQMLRTTINNGDGTSSVFSNIIMPITLTGATLDKFCTAVADQAGLYDSPYFPSSGGGLYLPVGVSFGCVGTSSSATFNFAIPLNEYYLPPNP